MSAQHPDSDRATDGDDNTLILDPAEADEEIEDDGDVPMDSDGEYDIEDIIALQNDSSAHFDKHSDSIFCIAQHPTDPKIVATGGGDDVACIFDSTPEPPPVLPASYQSNPHPVERKGLELIARLEGHKDSVNALAFTLPGGEFLATAGLDGQLLIWRDVSGSRLKWESHGSAQEVDEINWLSPCPSPGHPNSIALGASDGSVWVYEISSSKDAPMNIYQVYYLHTASSTAGAWTPDGSLLVTISEDGSFYALDPWGEATAAGVASAQGGHTIVGITAEDERFKVEGGLYSIAISPGGTLAAVGGAEGMIRVVGLPKLTTGNNGRVSASAGQVGQILASLSAQTDSVESLSFSDPPLTLMAAGSVDGSIVLFDVAHRYAVRRRIDEAHEDEAVVKVEFLKAGPRGANGWILTSCGNDGVVRRWDCRGGTSAAGKGLIKEFKGHRGGGEGGGVLGFVQGGGGSRIVTAGDE
jgi:ribosome assembly protein SQT1